MTNLDWRSIPGNEYAFGRVRELVKSGEAIAFVGAGASAGLYPLWGELIRELATQAALRGASDVDRDYWIGQSGTAPEVVADGIKRRFDAGTFAEVLREIFKPKSGPDGNYFTPLHGTLIRAALQGLHHDQFRLRFARSTPSPAPG